MIWLIRTIIGSIIMKITNFVWDLLRVEARARRALHLPEQRYTALTA